LFIAANAHLGVVAALHLDGTDLEDVQVTLEIEGAQLSGAAAASYLLRELGSEAFRVELHPAALRWIHRPASANARKIPSLRAVQTTVEPMPGARLEPAWGFPLGIS
jgi:hypothetical protein